MSLAADFIAQHHGSPRDSPIGDTRNFGVLVMNPFPLSNHAKHIKINGIRLTTTINSPPHALICQRSVAGTSSFPPGPRSSASRAASTGFFPGLYRCPRIPAQEAAPRTNQ